MRILEALFWMIAAFNVAILFVIMYWWVFTGEVPGIIQGRPILDVSTTLCYSALFAGATAAGVRAWRNL